MTDHDALLAAVRADPADDLRRGVYADYLRERGAAAHADFIEAQLALTRTPECGHRPKRDVAWWTGITCDRCRLWQAAERFLMSDAARPVRQLPWGLAPRGAVERGFLAAVRCDAERWVRYGDEVRAWHPVTRVELTTDPEYTFTWSAHPADAELPLNGSVYALTHDPAERRFTLAELVAVTRRSADAVPRRDDAAAVLVAARWPGVAFTLPAYPPPRAGDRDALDAVNAVLPWLDRAGGGP